MSVRQASWSQNYEPASLSSTMCELYISFFLSIFRPFRFRGPHLQAEGEEFMPAAPLLTVLHIL